MNPWVVHFYFPIFGTLFIPIDSLVFRFSGAGGNDCSPVVPGQVQVGEIDVGFISAWMGDTTFQVIRHQYLGNPAQKFKGADV